jgi:hypothetical protein
MVNAVLDAMTSRRLRRAVAALVLAAAPVLYALPVGPMSYLLAWVSLSDNQQAAVVLTAAMQYGCYFIPLAPPVCIGLSAL